MSINELVKPKAKGRKSKKPDNTMLLTLYQCQTAKELAEEYGVAESTMYAWIKEAREALMQENN